MTRIAPHPSSTRSQKKTFTPAYRRQPRESGKDAAFVEIAGRRQYLGDYGSPESRELYHRLIAEWEAGGRVVAADPQKITVAEVAAQYLKWANRYYFKNGHITAEPENIGLAIRPLLKLYGHAPASQFGPKALKVVRECFIERNMVRKYINRHVDRVKRMFKWAVAEEIVPSGIYEGLRAVSGLRYGRSGARDNPPVQPAPIEFVEPIKQHVSKQVAAMIDMQLLTGARPGEIIIMRPGDIDRSGPVWVYRPSEHKTEHHGHDRAVFIGPKAQEILAAFLLRPADAYCFSPVEAEQARRQNMHQQRTTPETCGNTVGTNRTNDPQRLIGDHYTQDSYRRAIDRGIEKAFPLPEHLGPQRKNDDRMETRREWQARLTKQQKAEIKAWHKAHHWHPHQLRHNYATMVRAEYGLEAAQVLLGHSKADVTQVYAERDMNRATQVAAKIG